MQKIQQCFMRAEGAEVCTSSSEGPALGPGLVRSLILKPVRLRPGQSKSFSSQIILNKSGTPCSCAEGALIGAELHGLLMAWVHDRSAVCDAVQALP